MESISICAPAVLLADVRRGATTGTGFAASSMPRAFKVRKMSPNSARGFPFSTSMSHFRLVPAFWRERAGRGRGSGGARGLWRLGPMGSELT